jgi:hypothetical protein
MVRSPESGKKWMYILWMIGDLRVQMDRYRCMRRSEMDEEFVDG